MLGGMIQRITRDMMSGFRASFLEWRGFRKEGRVVVGLRERRCIAQTGILRLDVASWGYEDY